MPLLEIFFLLGQLLELLFCATPKQKADRAYEEAKRERQMRK